ncbi:3-alpha-hydroxysteroid dehydrogenase/carbonyl reductase [Zhongshania aliphaticivorans]|uniref:3-alpha-hydroxysteroid dehydrogenase/carbonyl reductase n=1 Tax=Zhongshania aliphaticivorans TaxID=1470434 RepID=A0A5S9NA52_9GAMM|nr:SDR family oxidoreductase [Zhongshania aliphaticivorans]CAA0079662.1 3-alpha-hydroxysteroid dehydrogenase/carbonyl reductase [Zhongshania aliphaticivorans]CAA0086032.1 3-alpha-hydroxysteroid dehydrogenase/carbonyl reductase [Zhongshania aliphaticivorans]
MGVFALTGSATGIGAAIKTQLRDNGHQVIVVDLAEGDICADLSALAGRQKAIDGIRALAPDGLDGFIPCAGLGPSVRPLSLIPQVNYFAAVAMTEGLLDLLLGRKGSVVMIASNSAAMVGHDEYVELMLNDQELEACGYIGDKDGHSAYAGSKHALSCWLRRNAPEYARQGVRINAVAPGIINTPLSDKVLADKDLGAVMKDFGDSVPLGKTGEPEQIADVVCFILSRKASFMAGSIVFVDGGHDAMLRPDQF